MIAGRLGRAALWDPKGASEPFLNHLEMAHSFNLAMESHVNEGELLYLRRISKIVLHIISRKNIAIIG